MINTSQLTGLIDSVKTNKKALKSLKKLCVDLQLYELGAELRTIENECFPDSEDVKEAKKLGKEINLALRMVELNTEDSVAWLLCQTVMKFNELKGDFSLDDASKLQAKQIQLFDL